MIFRISNFLVGKSLTDYQSLSSAPARGKSIFPWLGGILALAGILGSVSQVLAAPTIEVPIAGGASPRTRSTLDVLENSSSNEGLSQRRHPSFGVLIGLPTQPDWTTQGRLGTLTYVSSGVPGVEAQFAASLRPHWRGLLALGMETLESEKSLSAANLQVIVRSPLKLTPMILGIEWDFGSSPWARFSPYVQARAGWLGAWMGQSALQEGRIESGFLGGTRLGLNFRPTPQSVWAFRIESGLSYVQLFDQSEWIPEVSTGLQFHW